MTSGRILAAISVGTAALVASVAILGVSIMPPAVATLANAAHAVAYTCAAVWAEITRSQLAGAIVGVALAASILFWFGVLLARFRLGGRLGRGSLPLPAALAALARENGLVENQVRLLAADRAFALTTGLWQPRVVVTTAAFDKLSLAELAAVLQHEAHHVRQREPLRRAILSALLAVIPHATLRKKLRAAYITASELEADAHAHDQNILGASILRLVAPPTPAVGFSPLDARVERLLNPNFRYSTRVATVFAIVTLVAALAVDFIAPRAVQAVYNTHPAMSTETHLAICREQQERTLQSCQQSCSPLSIMCSCAMSQE